MKPVLNENGVVKAQCPDCGAVSGFQLVHAMYSQGSFSYNEQQYSRLIYTTHRCFGCDRGGMSKIFSNNSHDNIKDGVLASFYPFSQKTAPLPPAVPTDIVEEFREAELCESFGANRAASALFRSVLEKILKANGYVKQGKNLRDLQSKIDEVAKDGIITEARRKRAHDEIRVLGNDVLHDDWREVTNDEVEAAHHYTQRILEDFYDERTEVEKILLAKGRIQPPTQAPQTSQPPVS